MAVLSLSINLEFDFSAAKSRIFFSDKRVEKLLVSENPLYERVFKVTGAVSACILFVKRAVFRAGAVIGRFLILCAEAAP